MTTGHWSRIRRGLAVAVAGLGTLACASGAFAADRLGTFDFWTAWSDTDQGSKICYISSNPQSREPASVNHGDVMKTHFVVTIRPGNRNEVAVIMDFGLQPTDPAALAGGATTPHSIAVDGRSYPVVAQSTSAWLASREDEPGFVGAMRAGSSMQARLTSGRGTSTVHTYSLRGVTAALNRANQECPQ